MSEETEPKPDGPGEHAHAAESGRLRRHLLTTVLLALVVVSATVVVLSYRVDVFPDSAADAAGLPGWRFTFLVLALAFVVYAVRRERLLRRLARRIAHEREEAALLRMKVADLGESDRIRRDVVSAATHELKTPLTSLLGYTTILRTRIATMSDAEREEAVDVLERQAQRILRQIEELLVSSRVDAGDLRLQRLPLDLCGIARAAAKEIAAVHERRVEVEAPERDLGLFGDPAAMEHVVLNLIDNACKYSREGAVRVAIDEHGGEVLLSVVDEGIGIPAEDLPFVFERYRQAPNARGRSSVGLGLYIVHNLVAAHGGRVWVESEPDKGSTFTIALPRRRP